jgi:hypothetical protein
MSIDQAIESLQAEAEEYDSGWHAEYRDWRRRFPNNWPSRERAWNNLWAKVCQRATASQQLMREWASVPDQNRSGFMYQLGAYASCQLNYLLKRTQGGRPQPYSQTDIDEIVKICFDISWRQLMGPRRDRPTHTDDTDDDDYVDWSEEHGGPLDDDSGEEG